MAFAASSASLLKRSFGVPPSRKCQGRPDFELPQPRSRTSCRPSALFGQKPKQQAARTVVPEPSYTLPLGLAGISAASAAGGKLAVAAVTALLGVFLGVQASRVRFRFESDALEVVLGEKGSKSENKFVGGENRWKYSEFTNWEVVLEPP